MEGLFLILMLAVLILNLLFIAWAIVDIMHRQNVRHLSKTGWIIVMAFILFGSVIYLLAGRGEDSPAA